SLYRETDHVLRLIRSGSQFDAIKLLKVAKQRANRDVVPGDPGRVVTPRVVELDLAVPQFHILWRGNHRIAAQEQLRRLLRGGRHDGDEDQAEQVRDSFHEIYSRFWMVE